MDFIVQDDEYDLEAQMPIRCVVAIIVNTSNHNGPMHLMYL